MSAKCQVSEAAVLEPKYKKPQPQTTEPFLRARFEQVLSPEQAPERKGDEWEFEIVGGLRGMGCGPSRAWREGGIKCVTATSLGGTGVWNSKCNTHS